MCRTSLGCLAEACQLFQPLRFPVICEDSLRNSSRLFSESRRTPVDLMKSKAHSDRIMWMLGLIRRNNAQLQNGDPSKGQNP